MATIVRRCAESLWCFLAVFLTCSVLQNMIGSFLSSGIQSIERQFQISSSSSGKLLSASRVGQISTGLILAYIGSKGNRARWIGTGSLIIATGCIIAALPNFIFPPKPVFKEATSEFVAGSLIIQSNDSVDMFNGLLQDTLVFSRTPIELRNLLNNTILEDDGDQENLYQYFQKSSSTNNSLVNNNVTRKMLVAYYTSKFSLETSVDLMNIAELPFGYCNNSILKLKKSIENETCKNRNRDEAANAAAYYMVYIAITLFGIGWSLPWTLGTPLIDDSVKRKSAPLYFAVIRSIRILGPVAGLWIGAGCYKLYVTLKDPPGMSPKDPRWIGAWWLGYLIVGSVLFVPSLLLFFYPQIDFKAKNKRRNSNSEKTGSKDEKQPANVQNEKIVLLVEIEPSKMKCDRFADELRKFGVAIALCLKSPVYVGILLGRIFDAFAFRGLHSFQAKYIENHFGTPMHEVSFFSGVVSAMSYAGGLVLGSFMMRRLKLDGRRAALYVLLCSVLSISLTLSKVFLSCQSVNNAVGQLTTENPLTTPCNVHCFCEKSNLYPVCSRDGTPFFSPCHAGCSNFSLNSVESTSTIFYDCGCANGTEVSRDYCQSDCRPMLFMYYGISVFTGIIAGTAGIPNMLISLRAVPHECRSVAMAFSSFVVSLLSSLPSPILVGSFIDGTCVLWNEVCGRRGACLLYDAATFRIRIHSIYGIFRAAGLLFDIWVWYWAANLLLLKKSKKSERKESEIKKLSISFSNGVEKTKDARNKT